MCFVCVSVLLVCVCVYSHMQYCLFSSTCDTVFFCFYRLVNLQGGSLRAMCTLNELKLKQSRWTDFQSMVCVHADVSKLYVLIQKIMMHAVTIKNNCHGHKSTRKMNHVCFFLSIWKVRCQFTSWTAQFKTFNDMRVFCCLVTDSWMD